MAASMVALSFGAASGALAQTNGLDPANLPPAEFEGREFTDSAGCAFLRSTFGGEVTWVPRYGPDRNPVCDRTPTDFSTMADGGGAQDSATAEQSAAPPSAEEAAAPETDSATADPSGAVATAQSQPTPMPEPEPERGRIEVVGAVDDPANRPAPGFLGKEPNVTSSAARQTAPRATPKQRLPRADASGRHPSCPASAPFGQLVDTLLGRKMVRCVTSPSLFLNEHVSADRQNVAHVAQPKAGHGSRIQVGSFAISGNAHRLVARLKARGLPAGKHRSGRLSVVTVGPLASGGAVQSALATVRAMGFGDAFLRR